MNNSKIHDPFSYKSTSMTILSHLVPKGNGKFPTTLSLSNRRNLALSSTSIWARMMEASKTSPSIPNHSSHLPTSTQRSNNQNFTNKPCKWTALNTCLLPKLTLITWRQLENNPPLKQCLKKWRNIPNSNRMCNHKSKKSKRDNHCLIVKLVKVNTSNLNKTSPRKKHLIWTKWKRIYLPLIITSSKSSKRRMKASSINPALNKKMPLSDKISKIQKNIRT